MTFSFVDPGSLSVNDRCRSSGAQTYMVGVGLNAGYGGRPIYRERDGLAYSTLRETETAATQVVVPLIVPIQVQRPSPTVSHTFCDNPCLKSRPSQVTAFILELTPSREWLITNDHPGVSHANARTTS